MSNALAIAAVTAALKDLIGNGLLGLDLSSIGSVTVSALPPDRIATGQTEPNQLNLFLYQVTPNIGWRNQALPTRDGSGARIGNPPLALDLHYMLTAYGAQDLSAEALLGFAMQFLHETPMLSRAQLRTVLGLPSPPFGNLSALSLADQVEWLKITPQFLGRRTVEIMDRDAGALSAIDGVSGVGGIDRIGRRDPCRAAGAQARRRRSRSGRVRRCRPQPQLGAPDAVRYAARGASRR